MSISRRQFGTLALSAVALATTGISTASAGSARKGTFTGHKNYTAQGSVKVVKKGGKTSVVLGNDFLFKGTPPDIKIGFGNGGTYAKGTKIHDKLTHKKGAATFAVPAGIDTDKYNEVYIYCEKFTVILGSAKIK